MGGLLLCSVDCWPRNVLGHGWPAPFYTEELEAQEKISNVPKNAREGLRQDPNPGGLCVDVALSRGPFSQGC